MLDASECVVRVRVRVMHVCVGNALKSKKVSNPYLKSCTSAQGPMQSVLDAVLFQNMREGERRSEGERLKGCNNRNITDIITVIVD